MRAVWSFWTKPFEARHGSTWASPKHHLLAWILSLATARRHFSSTALFTDDEGARMLVDGLGLEFDHLSTELNGLHDQDPEWWVLGKLHTYRSQAEPFVHIDSDVFLWNPLPDRMLRADVLGQNVEFFSFDDSWYRPGLFDSLIQAAQGWAPEEWSWYTSVRGESAVSCGIVGGNNADFLRHYADAAIRFVQHPDNARAWSLVGDKISDNVLMEQYFLSACIEYHRNKSDSPFQGLDVQYLFEPPEDPWDPDAAARVGYTHMIGLAKVDDELAQRLEARVRRDYPAQYERCVRYITGADPR